MEKTLTFIAISIVSILTFASIVSGQNNQNEQRNSPLVERFEKAIKTKEKRFTQHNIAKSERQLNRISSGIVWRFGENGVECEILEFDSEKEAIDYLYRGYINNLKDTSSDGRSKLTNLGDEAYITPNMYKKGNKTASLLVRKGNVLINMFASDQILGKRFAKYFVREIEKRDKGEP
ncbi:MAG TPA: hypothetical protein PKY82_23005 [Pyrinomonadaceae bacterium]|nr:hypothetical protein [Pyrinomonadaceae bacterium]